MTETRTGEPNMSKEVDKLKAEVRKLEIENARLSGEI